MNNRLPDFSNRFRALRGNRSQEEFARFCGISRPTVSFYENGARIPDAMILRQIAEKCNVSIDWLIGNDLRDQTDDEKIFQAALKMWGPDMQTVIVFEEMSELQKELCKHARGKENIEQISEEIADVQIMLEQMIVLFGCKDAVESYKRSKIQRLKIRLGISD